MNRISKFLIVCAIVFAAGTVLALAGFAAGGVGGIDKVAEKYDWLKGSPGAMQTAARHGLQFDSVVIDGTADLYVAGPEYWEQGMKRYNRNAGKGEMLNEAAAGDVYVRHGENVPEPVVKTESGVLVIETHDDNDGAVEMNFSGDDGIPDVIVFCSEKTMESMSVRNPYGRIEINGVGIRKADIACDTADVSMECVTGGDLNIQGGSCDVGLHGTFRGSTDVSVLSGDIRFETAVDRGEYDISAATAAGEIKDGEYELQGHELHSRHHTGEHEGHEHEGQGNSGHPLILKADSGDISLWFGDTAF